MTVIAVISPKGGVGKTTVTANLSAALARMGHAVGVVDLDPQNALRLHFGMPPHATEGVAPQTLLGLDWRPILFQSRFSVDFLPYGAVTDGERMRLERHLEEHPGWLRDNLAALGEMRPTVILVDTPPGPSVYQNQALQAADLALVVLQPDAGSCATIPAIEALLARKTNRHGEPLPHFFLLNQMDAARALSRDIHGMLQHRLQSRLIATVIHRDEAVSEALACQQPALYYAAQAQAVHDIEAVAQYLRPHFIERT